MDLVVTPLELIHDLEPASVDSIFPATLVCVTRRLAGKLVGNCGAGVVSPLRRDQAVQLGQFSAETV